ncbi:hypothetical protein NSQ91_28450 [Paenibacillus sp. FSL R7-0048]|uniref:hypothetical protein n=1 Tax=Paenibacillus TaxID=44249 RepID=UPI00096D9210|nr:hypothetical protein [Paenibacillus odorifer]OMD67389.1 hypothetical protein BSK48_20020 [Paenibacillus odorifer]OMD78639.1 hypothetical protein BSK53_23490 [Paenibacillus odorifer]
MELLIPVSLIDHDDARNCTEESLATIASFLGKDHMLMYKDAWHFAYVTHDLGAGPYMFGPLLKHDEKIGHNLEYLAQYHGIRFHYLKKSTEPDISGFVMDELKDSRPVALDIDGFWCPWIAEYQTKHIDHGIVISGVDRSRCSFICTDSFYGKNGVTLPFNHLDNGLLGVYRYELTSSQIYRYEQIGADILANYEKYGSLESLEEFTADFGRYFDFATEIEGVPGYDVSLFYINFDRYRKNRNKMSKLLAFIAHRSQSEKIHGLSTDMHEIYRSWDIFHKYMLKLYLSGKFDGVKEKVIRYLNDILVKETQFYEKLKHANTLFNYL